MWYEFQWDNCQCKSQFIKVNHYRSRLYLEFDLLTYWYFWWRLIFFHSRYAFSPLLDADEDEEDETSMNDAFGKKFDEYTSLYMFDIYPHFVLLRNQAETMKYMKFTLYIDIRRCCFSANKTTDHPSHNL